MAKEGRNAAATGSWEGNEFAKGADDPFAAGICGIKQQLAPVFETAGYPPIADMRKGAWLALSAVISCLPGFAATMPKRAC
jgi:hypothetical protein